MWHKAESMGNPSGDVAPCNVYGLNNSEYFRNLNVNEKIPFIIFFSRNWFAVEQTPDPMLPLKTTILTPNSKINRYLPPLSS